MKNNKGQSLIDVVFSIGIIVLVLTGVVVLVVSTAKIKRITLERQKAVELSQLLIEKQILDIKNDTLGFWDGTKTNSTNNQGFSIGSGFINYSYDIVYSGCNNQACNVIFTVKWGDLQELSVERLFLRRGI